MIVVKQRISLPVVGFEINVFRPISQFLLADIQKAGCMMVNR